ncbi:hypothetical protein CLOM_g16886, partial [Closterium sp. NIES-68]
LVRVVRVSGHAIRTHQRTGNLPSRDEPHSTPTFGRMCGGVPGRNPYLLAQYEAARQTPATCLKNSSTRTLLLKVIQKRIRHKKTPIPRTYGERSSS